MIQLTYYQLNNFKQLRINIKFLNQSPIEITDLGLCYIYCYYFYFILLRIVWSLVYLKLFINNIEKILRPLIINIESFAVANLINGETDAPIVPVALTHPKLNEVT